MNGERIPLFIKIGNTRMRLSKIKSYEFKVLDDDDFYIGGMRYTRTKELIISTFDHDDDEDGDNNGKYYFYEIYGIDGLVSDIDGAVSDIDEVVRKLDLYFT